MTTEEIVLEREVPQVMKLNEDEQAILDEIEISPTHPPIHNKFQRRNKPKYKARLPPEPEIDAFMNPNKQTAPRAPGPEPVYDYGGDDEEPEGGEEYEYEDDDRHGGSVEQRYTGEEMPSKGFSSIDDEKADLLNKLTRLEKKGFAINKKLNAYSNISELRTEGKRIMYSIEVDQSIKFSRRMLIACATGVEFLNKRYNPFDVMLEGWSESIMENVDDYDGVFEELYNKYKTKMEVAPEVKLIMMLGGSAMMFHLTNSMFKSAIPNMNDVMKQNPDLLKNMVSAVQNTQQNSTGIREDPTIRPSSVTADVKAPGGRREMQGPGLDISSLMGGIMMPPPPPVNTKPLSRPNIIEEDEYEGESISDIVSISGESTNGETREVRVSGGSRRKRTKKKKNEVNI
jgi:hypothetical protein